MSDTEHQLVLMLLVYISACTSFGVVSAILWVFQKDTLFRTLSIAWFSGVASIVAQAALPQRPFPIALALLLSFPTYALLGRLLADLAGIPLTNTTLVRCFLIGLGGSLAAAALDQPFWLVSLPSTLSVAFPCFSVGVQIFGRRQNVGFEIRALGVVFLLIALHLMDYPFLRMNLSFAPFGFGISLIFVAWTAVLAPYAILQKVRDEVLVRERQARVAAEQAVGAMDEFVSLASHEFKTPVTSMLLRLSGIKREIERHSDQNPIPPDRLNRLAEQSMRQMEQLARMVDNLLSVPRMRSGLIELHPEKLDLRMLVIEGVERFLDPRLIIEEAKVAEGYWDRLALERVITNLISNALKYGSEKPVTIRLSVLGHEAVLEIKDQGIGIEPELLGKIFEPYHRAPSASGFGGMGLGLYIVRQIVSAQHGEVSVESQLGKGSRFTVKLPILEKLS